MLIPMPTDAIISVNDLHKSYATVEAVRGISFEVAAGEVFGLLGPNGAGKTTTVEVLEGLLGGDATSRRWESAAGRKSALIDFNCFLQR
jgi:ABC-type multidrug transport system ATPase subunit